MKGTQTRQQMSPLTDIHVIKKLKIYIHLSITLMSIIIFH